MSISHPGSAGTRSEAPGSGRLGPASFATDWSGERPLAGAGPLILVVGLDGSAPALRAFESAVRVATANGGRLEIVYVAHLPGSAGMVPQAVTELEAGFDQIAQELLDEVDERLRGTDLTWHFQRREGSVAHELAAAAGELRQQFGPDATVGLIVGGSAHRYHRAIGSVSSALGRLDRYPFMVVP